MGGNWSSLEREPSPDPWWPAPQLDSCTHATDQDLQKNEAAETSVGEDEERRPKGKVRKEELEKFKEELAQKRALRHEALGALQAELLDLRSRVAQTDELKKELEEQRKENKKLSMEKERLLEQMEQKAALEKQVQSLKDVAEIGKEMLRIRELQVKELKKKLVEINISSVTSPPEDLRIEYEKQIENIRKLRTLYEERAAATLLEHRRQLEREEARITVLEAKLSELQKETDECKEAKKDLEGKIEKLENTIKTNEDELETTKDKLFSTTIQNKSLNSQINLINNLFSQMLVSPNVDLDQLIRLLKENHGLITDLTENGDVNEVASLLVDLASQIEKEKIEKIKSEETLTCDTTEQSAEEYEHGDESENSQLKIASNLSKVWKVMIELLSHHQNSGETEISGGAESCYKSIQTPSGPRSVISVSQTFITLKDLILEKNRLVKEVGRLKTLNCHLEHRLGSQEKRLIVVTSELRKTWGVVNKLKAQHKQLHTHEKILRYELQQKRCMLNELKLELDHCRDKWEQARQKNSQTEEDWKKLRKEFAARKSRKESNSAESGFEEDDVAQSPPSEPISSGECLFVIKKSESGETELSEEDIEHSDGNSFDTVIDMLDIACIGNEGETEIPFALNGEPPETQEFSPGLLPLSGSEFTEGLDQIESEDLAAVLDVQYQTQLLGADYNLSLPSSSGSSPIPNENDDFALSEMDVSEEDSSTNDNHVYTTPLPAANQNISEDKLLFGSNSSTNISKFLEGLFTENENSENQTQQNLHIAIPSTSERDENGSTTPIVNNENCYEFSGSASLSQCVSEDNLKQTYLNDVNEYKEIKLNPNIEQQVTSISETLTSTPSSMESKNMNDSSSKSTSSENRATMEEESLRNREERLKKLEKQCRSLVSKVMSTSFKSEVLSNKRDELHQCHISSKDHNTADETTSCQNNTQTPDQLSEKMQSFSDSCQEASSSKVTDSTTLHDGNFGHNKETDINISKPENIPGLLPLQTNSEETLELRAERVKKLEDQCKTLFTKMSASSQNKTISNKLVQRHDPSTSSNSTVSLESQESSNPEKTTFRCYKDPQINTESKQNIFQNTEEETPLNLRDLDSESKAILSKFSGPGPQLEPATSSNDDSKKNRTPEQILEARAERFKRLEEQCKSLVSRMTATSLRSEIISNKLDELHSCYGSTESASGSEEPSSLEDRVRPSPSSSPKNSRRVACSLGYENHEKEPNVQEREEIEPINQERVNFIPTEQTQSEQNISSTTDKAKKTPEEILQARAQRLNRLEEQCKSLFSKMSATSQRSDVISNKLEELHEQYGQPSTSQNREYRSNSSKTVVKNETEESETTSDRKACHSDKLNQKERSRSPSTSSEE